MYLTLTDHLNEDIIPSVSTPGFADKTLWDPTRLMLMCISVQRLSLQKLQILLRPGEVLRA